MSFPRLRLVALVFAALGFGACDGPTAPVVGGLVVSVTGLKSSVPAGVTITGPRGFNQIVNGTQTLTDLAPGTYTVAAADIPVSGGTYVVSAASQTVIVNPGAEASVAVTYAARTSFNLNVEGMYLTQAVQTYAGSVPLVAGRDGYLRVFATANENNDLTPPIRVRFYVGGVLQRTEVIPASHSLVPLAADEGTLGSSWNVAVPGSVIQPGLSVIADVDPDDRVLETNESDNQLPASGQPFAMNVRPATPLSIRLVPIQQSDGSLGDVSDVNKGLFMATTQKMHPIPGYDADVRAPYITTVPATEASNANGSWQRILSEINALRIAEGSSRYYYGVLKASYRSGIAGMGYVPGRASIGWDHLPSGSEVLAHELGHNWGRWHSPCGGAGSPDANFPHAGGSIGAFGLDVATNTLKPPSHSDLMGYCRDKWISDYTYRNILAHRESASANPPGTGSAEQPSLLVWGRVAGDRLELEPAFEITARPSLPSRRGPFLVEGLDANDARIFSVSFAGDQVADSPDGARQFALAVPLTAAQKDQLVRVRLVANGSRAVVTTASRKGQSLQPPLLRRLANRRLGLRWNQESHPMVMVRDAQTGAILSFARGGEVSLGVQPGRMLDLVFSDRVRSQVQRITVQQ